MMQVLLLGAAEHGIEHARQLCLVCLDRGGELASAVRREADARGPAVVGIGFAADQARTLDPVGELAGAADRDAERLGEVADP